MNTLLVLLLVTQAADATAGFPRFVEVAAELGVDLENRAGSLEKAYIVESVGNGAGWLDYDDDGDLDLLLTNGATTGQLPAGSPMLVLYENATGRFVDVTSRAGLGRNGWGSGVCIADYDNDGDPDVYLTAVGPNALYRNDGDGTFSENTAAGVADPGWGTSCAFSDYDRDGSVDLSVANYVVFDDSFPVRCRYLDLYVFCGPTGLAAQPDVLFHNNGDGTFTDATGAAGLALLPHYGMAAVFSDFDNDGWPDLYVANDSVPNLLFRNQGNGTFSEIGTLSGTSTSATGMSQAGMGVGVGDYDANGYFDIFVTNFAQDTNTLYQNLGEFIFHDATLTAGLGKVSLAYLGWGTGFRDLDNDGYVDIFVVNGHVYPDVDTLEIGQHYLQRKEIYRNLGDGRFTEIAPRLGGDLLTPRAGRGAAFGDFDNDGDIDVVVVNLDAPPSVYRNEGGDRRHWIGLELEGSSSNRDAIGARVEVTSEGRTQVGEVRSGGSYLSHDDMRLHFGLGAADVVERLRVRWPSGLLEEASDVGADRYIRIREGEGLGK